MLAGSEGGKQEEAIFLFNQHKNMNALKLKFAILKASTRRQFQELCYEQ